MQCCRKWQRNVSDWPYITISRNINYCVLRWLPQFWDVFAVQKVIQKSCSVLLVWQCITFSITLLLNDSNLRQYIENKWFAIKRTYERSVKCLLLDMSSFQRHVHAMKPNSIHVQTSWVILYSPFRISSFSSIWLSVIISRLHFLIIITFSVSAHSQ